MEGRRRSSATETGHPGPSFGRQWDGAQRDESHLGRHGLDLKVVSLPIRRKESLHSQVTEEYPPVSQTPEQRESIDCFDHERTA